MNLKQIHDHVYAAVSGFSSAANVQRVLSHVLRSLHSEKDFAEDELKLQVTPPFSIEGHRILLSAPKRLRKISKVAIQYSDVPVWHTLEQMPLFDAYSLLTLPVKGYIAVPGNIAVLTPRPQTVQAISVTYYVYPDVTPDWTNITWMTSDHGNLIINMCIMKLLEELPESIKPFTQLYINALKISIAAGHSKLHKTDVEASK